MGRSDRSLAFQLSVFRGGFYVEDAEAVLADQPDVRDGIYALRDNSLLTSQIVDSKMRSIAARTQTVDSLRVAILAALNIADEYHQLRARHDAVGEEVGRKLGACTEVIDEILKQGT